MIFLQRWVPIYFLFSLKKKDTHHENESNFTHDDIWLGALRLCFAKKIDHRFPVFNGFPVVNWYKNR
jgi:hypothetical protein